MLTSRSKPLTLDFFLDMAEGYVSRLDADSTLIDMLAAFVPHCLAAGTEQEIIEPYLQAQLASGAQGTCFLHRGDLHLEDLQGFVGKPAWQVMAHASDIVKITLLDALFAHINTLEKIEQNETYQFSGTYSEKSWQRAQKLIEIAGVQDGQKVAVIGVVYDIVRAVLEKTAEVRLSDFGQHGKNILNLPIGVNSTELIKWADVAFVTGNILKTGTVNELLTAARQYSTKLHVFAMTGANIAPRYLDYGASLVTVEDFPYYWFANTECVNDLRQLV